MSEKQVWASWLLLAFSLKASGKISLLQSWPNLRCRKELVGSRCCHTYTLLASYEQDVCMCFFFLRAGIIHEAWARNSDSHLISTVIALHKQLLFSQSHHIYCMRTHASQICTNTWSILQMLYTVIYPCCDREEQNRTEGAGIVRMTHKLS